MTPERIEELRRDYEGGYEKAYKYIPECLDEIERLRAALEEIAGPRIGRAGMMPCTHCGRCERIARRALEEEK